jgi:hypothetical protein
VDGLRQYLTTLTPGAIENTEQIETLLAACWDEFAGHDADGLAGHKLRGRMENVTWNPPVLAFDIERHGGTVLGSSRAEVHSWSVDLEQMIATCRMGRHRQLTPMQPRLKVEPIVEEITRLIINRQQDDRLRWRADGTVQVLVGKILPEGSAVKQTLAGRRKRFRKALTDRLKAEGWPLVKPPSTFGQSKPASKQGS